MKDVTDSLKTNKRYPFKFLNKWKKNARILYISAIISILLYYYFVLPPLHYASVDFWILIFIVLVLFMIIEALHDAPQKIKQLNQGQISFKDLFSMKWKFKVPLMFIVVGPIIWTLLSFVFSPFFMAKSYSTMINIEMRDFSEDFPETDVSKITLVDRDTAMRLAERQLGDLSELVSQFQPASDYTQINIKEYPYRVTPLEYVDFFRWLNNFQKGIQHYIKVDNVTGKVELTESPAPIKYSFSDKFHRNIYRKLRFSHPFTLFQTPSFEIDDEGNPYYVATTYTRNFLIREPEANGVILVNAMTGESQKYDLDHTPEWIDRVYSSDLILHQLKMAGHYKNGFWNSVFAKEGMTEPTEGYNYLPMNDDIYLYTGITSVALDESNIGFVLVNMRTKETVMYPLSAAEEFSAMQSAEGSVQEKNYRATFPLLINIHGNPFYILSLKDNSGIIKEYALIDAQNYQYVITAPSVERLIEEYVIENPLDQPIDINMHSEENVVIDTIQSVVQDGNTLYYILIGQDVYQANIDLNKQLPFMQSGDIISFKANSAGQMIEIHLEE